MYQEAVVITTHNRDVHTRIVFKGFYSVRSSLHQTPFLMPTKRRQPIIYNTSCVSTT
jgi:hypothetical protein